MICGLCVSNLFIKRETLILRWIAIRSVSLAGLFSGGLAVYLMYGRRVGTADFGFSLTMAGACFIR